MTAPEDKAGGSSSSRIICTFCGILPGVRNRPSIMSVSTRSTTLAAAADAAGGGGGGGGATRNESNCCLGRASNHVECSSREVP